jgi:hypothetical protein
LFFFFDEDRVGPWPLLQGDQWTEDQVSLEHLIATLAAYQVRFIFIFIEKVLKLIVINDSDRE